MADGARRNRSSVAIIVRPPRLSDRLLAAAPAVAVGLLCLPILAGLAGVVLPSLGYLPALGGTTVSLEPWRQLLAEPGLQRSVLISLFSGLTTGAVALVIVFLFLAGAADTRADRIMRRAISPLLSVPHAAAAFGFAFLIAPSGLFVRLLSPWATGWQRPPDLLIVNDPWGLAMMAGLVQKEIPFLLLMCLSALPQIDAARRMAVARSLGYRPVAAWLKTVAPALYPLVRLPVYAVIAYSSSVVDVALILGPSNPPPLSVAVVKWLSDPELSRRYVASAGALLQLGVTVAALVIWRMAELAVARATRPWLANGSRSLADRGLALVGRLGVGAAVLASALGLASLAVWSIAGLWRFPDLLPRSFTLERWGQAGTLAGPLAATMLIGLVSTAVSMSTVVAALENELRRGRSAGPRALQILYLPLVVPPVAFLFGLVIAAETAGVRPGFWPIVLGHIVFVLPYVYLSLAEAYRRLDPRWSMIAASLGASPDSTFLRVRLPMLLSPCLTAFAVGFAVSVGQYLATQLLGAGRVATLTTEAVALSTGGDRRVIGVLALAQSLLPAVMFAVAVGVPRLIWRNRRLMRGRA